MSLKVKYPRTFHFHNSPNLQNDDRMLLDYSGFLEDGNPIEVIATIKMDGENTTMYNDHLHARSLDSAHHESRTYVKSIHNSMKHLIPEGMRVCGENMQAKHSIYYTGLPAYFLIFNIWQNDICLSYEETMMWVDEFKFQGVPCEYVPTFYHGPFSIQHITDLFHLNCFGHEGFVIRDINSFSLLDFNKKVGKYVRKGHVQTDEHWINQKITFNQLRKSSDEPLLAY